RRPPYRHRSLGSAAVRRHPKHHDFRPAALIGPTLHFSALYRRGSGEMLLLTAIYFVIPVGRLSLRHALIGGATATLLWEVMRHILAWYYTTMSQIQLVYGSLTT